MKIYGFLKEVEAPNLLEQVTLELDEFELRKLAKFLLQCATEIENDEEWEHEHLSDYLESDLEQELVIYNSKKNN
ncbi:MAG: hypothetical protein GY820_06420 [Gammaproteobacteria bacterium]|nr:hypothetical protein [Gammaproteobacteria bacterium]